MPPPARPDVFDWIYDPQAWVALATLTSLEIVLGIDNIVFISILTGRLPEEQQPRARFLGLALAMGMRIGLLFSIAWVMSLTTPLFTIPFLDTLTGFGESARHGMALLGEATGLADGPAQITGRDLILLVGGVFLVGKATHEIHNKLEGEHEQHGTAKKVASFGAVLFQIALLDIVFSLDSVITAVGMADDIAVMVIAVVIAVGIMMISAGPVSEFVQKHPTVKMLALAFLILIGVTLMAEGMNQHIPKGYIYSAMAFSLFVEVLNLRAKKAKQTPPPVELHGVPVAPPTNPDA